MTQIADSSLALEQWFHPPHVDTCMSIAISGLYWDGPVWAACIFVTMAIVLLELGFFSMQAGCEIRLCIPSTYACMVLCSAFHDVTRILSREYEWETAIMYCRGSNFIACR